MVFLEAIYEYSDVRRFRGHWEYLQRLALRNQRSSQLELARNWPLKQERNHLRLSILNSGWGAHGQRTKGRKGLCHIWGMDIHEAKTQRANAPRMSPASWSCVYLYGCYLVTLDPKYSELSGCMGTVTCWTLNWALYTLSYLISMDIPLNVWKWDHFYFIWQGGS